jgi:hypothetical protein
MGDSRRECRDEVVGQKDLKGCAGEEDVSLLDLRVLNAGVRVK